MKIVVGNPRVENNKNCLNEYMNSGVFKIQSTAEIYAESNEQLNFIVSSIVRFDSICKIHIYDYFERVVEDLPCELTFSVEYDGLSLESKVLKEAKVIINWIARDVINNWRMSPVEINFEIVNCSLICMCEPGIHNNIIDVAVMIDGCKFQVTASDVTLCTFEIESDDLKMVAQQTGISSMGLNVLFAKANLDQLCGRSIGNGMHGM